MLLPLAMVPFAAPPDLRDGLGGRYIRTLDNALLPMFPLGYAAHMGGLPVHYAVSAYRDLDFFASPPSSLVPYPSPRTGAHCSVAFSIYDEMGKVLLQNIAIPAGNSCICAWLSMLLSAVWPKVEQYIPAAKQLHAKQLSLSRCRAADMGCLVLQ